MSTTTILRAIMYYITSLYNYPKKTSNRGRPVATKGAPFFGERTCVLAHLKFLLLRAGKFQCRFNFILQRK